MRAWRIAWTALLVLATGVHPAVAQVQASRFDYGLTARALADGVWVVEGANADFAPANGCNIINTGFIATGAGVVVINTGPSKRYGEQLRRLIERTTPEPIAQVIHLNLHPDYFLGNQAFADMPRRSTPTTRDGMKREGKAYEDNLYRVCGDWMLGTTATPGIDPLAMGPFKVGSREMELREWTGHTASDVVLWDKRSGVMFAGGLIFADRMPTTPHATPQPWLQSLTELAALQPRIVVPSHGPVHEGGKGLAQTRDYLQWLDASFARYAQQGLDMPEVLRMPVPTRFQTWAAHPAEYVRQVAHLYPRYERAVLTAPTPQQGAR